jgi:hypothetical protein
MQSFNVYPRKGEMLKICREVQRREDGYAVEHEDGGFLWRRHLAAIIPETVKTEETPNCFLIYLKRHSKPAKVFAWHVRTAPEIVFTTKEKKLNPDQTASDIEQTIDNIYIDGSEVVAIVPSSAVTETVD